MNNLIENIVSYIDYLNKDCGLIVSVHFRNDVFNHIHDRLASMILPYNCHTNAYCVMAKNSNHNKCLLNQKKILAKCQRGESFCHICHAEVHEYIYPICKNDDTVGFIKSEDFSDNFCGGFSGGNKSFSKLTCSHYNRSVNVSRKFYQISSCKKRTHAVSH